MFYEIFQTKFIEIKRVKGPDSESGVEDIWLNVDSCPQSPENSDSDASGGGGGVSAQEETSNDAHLADMDFTNTASSSK